jgi:hypothetical protein
MMPDLMTPVQRIAFQPRQVSLSVFSVHDAGHFGGAYAVDSPDQTADFSGHALRPLFVFLRFRKVQLDLQINMGPRHFPMIR